MLILKVDTTKLVFIVFSIPNFFNQQAQLREGNQFMEKILTVTNLALDAINQQKQ